MLGGPVVPASLRLQVCRRCFTPRVVGSSEEVRLNPDPWSRRLGMDGPDNRDQKATTPTSRWRSCSCKNRSRFPTSQRPLPAAPCCLSPPKKGRGLVLWVHHSGLLFPPRTRMGNRKPKRLSKPSQQHILLGIATNIAVVPLGFKVEPDAGPEGEQSLIRI